MGNGAKAANTRARKEAKGPKEAKSQLKSVYFTNPPIKNAAAKTFKCKTCFQDFQSTTRRSDLEVHADSRHNKKYEDCFE
ncbi:DUF1909-domain-containing protein [Teratosphaeria destructans]|uniref:DUF1909-domain-containing protein n=1 Tax=Teratosphaeria destructans TaxID=418781 RepID=A0A9W7W0H4_9PEZI|nr:DUF1909-domain-containing protein [Teratosphaeria destructans]